MAKMSMKKSMTKMTGGKGGKSPYYQNPNTMPRASKAPGTGTMSNGGGGSMRGNMMGKGKMGY